MKTDHHSSERNGRSRVRIDFRDAAWPTELHRDLIGMHQEIDLKQTEEDLLAELEVLTHRVDFVGLATHNGPHGSTEGTMSEWGLILQGGARPLGFLSQPLSMVFGSRRVQAILKRVRAVLGACLAFLVLPIWSTLILSIFVIAEMWDRRRPDMHWSNDVAERGCSVPRER